MYKGAIWGKQIGNPGWVHFLWPTQYRKAVIERKVRAKRQGRRLGNLLHHRQDELSEDDLRRRLARVAQEVGAAWAWARPSDDESPPDPPAPHTHAPNAVSRAITLSRGDASVVGDLLRVVDDAAPATGESEPIRTIRLG